MATPPPMPMGSSGPHDFTNTSSLELPNHGSGNPFGGNAVGQAAAAGPHGAGSPFASSSGIGSAAPAFGGASSPFGGGGGMGDNIQKLIKSNTDLITALNNLTKAVRGESGLGGGGGGGLGLGGGGFGGGMGGLGGSALDRQLLYGARGANQRVSGQPLPRGGLGVVNRGEALLNYGPHGNLNTAAFDMSGRMGQYTSFEQIDNDPGLSPNDRVEARDEQTQFNESLGRGFGRGVRYGAGGFFRSGYQRVRGFFRGSIHSPLGLGEYLGNKYEADTQRIAQGVMSGYRPGMTDNRGYIYGRGEDAGFALGRQAQNNYSYQQGAAAGQRFRDYLGASAAHYTKQLLRGTRDYGFRLGAATSVVDMAAATPFVGGALAAPIGSLQNQGMQAAILELPAAMVSAFGPAFSRGPTGMGAVTRHKAYLTEMAGLFGIDAKGALDMARETLMQGSGGYTTTEELVGTYVTAFGAGFDPAAFSRNASFRMAGSNLQNTRFGARGRLDAIGMAAQLGLKGAGASQFVGGVESMGAMFRNMGIDMQGGTYGEIMKLALSGYTSLSGIGAVEAYGRIRQKTTISSSQSLNSMFGGIANDIMMAQAIMESGGDLDKASAVLEGASIAGGKGLLRRGTGLRDGSQVFELLQMGQGLTVAERRYGRMRTGTVGGLDVGDVQGIGAASRGRRLTNDIDISAKLAQDRLEVLENFQTGRTKEGVAFTEAFKQLTDQNKAIEKAIIEGISIKDFDKIVQAAQKINEKLQYVPKIIDWLLKKIGV